MDHLAKIEWILSKHRETNHKYDEYLPYEFHLKMAVWVFTKYKYLIKPNWEDKHELATWGHDLIEDTRTSYNDIKSVLGKEVADLIYALTNEKGKNRKERANDKYYQGIKEVPGAVFIKLCDRVANVEYSRISGSSKLYMYKLENEEFLSKLKCHELDQYKDLINYLNSLF